MKSRLIILGVAAIFFALVAGLIYRNRSVAAPVVNATAQIALVRLEPLKPKQYTLHERVNGVIQANIEVELSFQITGRIQLLGRGATLEKPKTIDEASIVRKGDVIAVIEPERFEAQLRVAEAQVQVRKADLDRTNAALAEAKSLAQDAKDEYDRTLAAAERGATTAREVERARLAFDAARARARSAQATRDAATANVLAAKAERKQAQVRLSDATLRSPIDGSIAALLVEPGQTVSPGQTIARLVDDSTVKLRAGVVERRAMRFLAGQQADVFVRALDGQASVVRSVGNTAITGEVTIVPPAADPDTGIFYIEIRIDNRPDSMTGGKGLLRAGMIARAEVEIATDDFILVPEETVVYINGLAYVYMATRRDAPLADKTQSDSVADAPLIAKLTPINPVAEDDRFVLLREAPAGVALIAAGQNLIHDGEPVRTAQQDQREVKTQQGPQAAR